MSGAPVDRIYFPNSSTCFVCGEDNHAGLQTRFYLEGDVVKSKITPETHHCGFKDIVHGGVVAAIVDECMGWAASRAIERFCVTGELTIRYVQHVPNDRELTVGAEVVKSNKRLVLVEGFIVDADSVTYATAKGKFLPMTAEETLAIDEQLKYEGAKFRPFDRLRAEWEGRDAAAG